MARLTSHLYEWHDDDEAVRASVNVGKKLFQASNKHLLIQQQIQQQQQKQLELELRQSGGGGGGSSADSLREVVNAAISLEFQRQRDRDYNSRQVGS